MVRCFDKEDINAVEQFITGYYQSDVELLYFKVVSPRRHIYGKKNLFFLPLRYLHEYLEFFDQIFFKPQVKLEIYRFRMFFSIIWLVEMYFIDPKREGPDIFR